MEENEAVRRLIDNCSIDLRHDRNSKVGRRAGIGYLHTGSHTRRGYITITAVASATSRVSIGICVASIYPRHPMVTASMAMRVDEFCGKRLILGVGTGG